MKAFTAAALSLLDSGADQSKTSGSAVVPDELAVDSWPSSIVGPTMTL